MVNHCGYVVGPPNPYLRSKGLQSHWQPRAGELQWAAQSEGWKGRWPGPQGIELSNNHISTYVQLYPITVPHTTLYLHYLLLWLLHDAFVLKPLPQVPMGGWCSIACDWRAWVHLWFTELLHHPPLGCMSWMRRWWTTPPKYNTAPEKWCSGDYFPFGKVTFQGLG